MRRGTSRYYPFAKPRSYRRCICKGADRENRRAGASLVISRDSLKEVSSPASYQKVLLKQVTVEDAAQQP